MPPKEPPAETADADDATISKQLEAAYKKGVADTEAKFEAIRAEGYEAGKKDGFVEGKAWANRPRGIFEAARREVVEIIAPDEANALRQIDAIMEQKRTEYPDEKMPRQDREVLLQYWRKADARRRAHRNADQAPRQVAKDPFQNPPVVEYEVVQ